MKRKRYRQGFQLGYIRPGKPVDNRIIGSFNGRLRDEGLNLEVVLPILDAQSGGAWTTTSTDRIARSEIRHRRLLPSPARAMKGGTHVSRVSAVPMG